MLSDVGRAKTLHQSVGATLQNRAIFFLMSASMADLGAADEDVGLDADLAQLTFTECWVGLVFTSPAAARYGTSVRCK
jgi:hypothetical protein